MALPDLTQTKGTAAVQCTRSNERDVEIDNIKREIEISRYREIEQEKEIQEERERENEKETCIHRTSAPCLQGYLAHQNPPPGPP